MGTKCTRQGKQFLLYLASSLIFSLFSTGCQTSSAILSKGDADIKETNLLMKEGNFSASLTKSQETLRTRAQTHGDKALLQIGLVYAHPNNGNLDYAKSRQYLQRLVKTFPESEVSNEADVLYSLLELIEKKEHEIKRLREKTQDTKKEQRDKDEDINELQTQISELENKLSKLKKENQKLNKQVEDYKKQILYITDQLVEVLVKQIEHYKKQVDKFKEVDLEIEKKKRDTLQE